MAAQRLAQNGLAVAFVIDVSGVEIVHAPIQGVADHARRFRFIDEPKLKRSDFIVSPTLSCLGMAGFAFQRLAGAPIFAAANLRTSSSNRSWPTTSDIRIQT